ncbi:MAG TPA: energy transducer TonB, partial [Pseudoxanthomonas sp.]|nr:energy transducer TonB [Pseudoxanthomonas sp.]
PVSVGNLAYVRATPPPYPRVEARAGVQGTVLLKVLVDVDGKPLEVVVLESSGNRSLDRSAREHVLRTWLFQPAMRDGKAVQAYGKVPVVFSMQ